MDSANTRNSISNDVNDDDDDNYSKRNSKLLYGFPEQGENAVVYSEIEKLTKNKDSKRISNLNNCDNNLVRNLNETNNESIVTANGNYGDCADSVESRKNKNLKYNDYINHLYNKDFNRKPESLENLHNINLWINNENNFKKCNSDSVDKSNCNTSSSSWNFSTNKQSSVQSENCSLLTATPNDNERPVLHVQFVSDNHSNNDDDDDDDDNNYKNHHNILRRNSIEDIDIKSNQSLESSTSSSSSSSTYSQYSEARAPDGGWGWVIVFASFMINLIADGITFSFGVIFVEFLNYFGEAKSKTAWIGSFFMAIPLLSGPIASFLTDRYGCRRVTIAGSILSCLGFVLSALSNSMELLFLTFGVIAGFGLSLCYVAAVVIVAYYFEKRRSFATGLSVCGSGIGTFIFAPFIQFLLEQYGWRGTTLILAGVFLNMTIFGLLMRDLEWTTHEAKQKAKQKKHKKITLSADSFSFSASTNTGGTTSCSNQQTANNADFVKNDANIDPKLFSSLVTLPTFLKNGDNLSPEILELLASHKNIQAIILKYPNLAHSRSFSEPYATERTIDEINKFSDFKSDFNTLPEKGTKTGINHRHNFSNYKENSNRQQPSAAYLKDLRIHRHSLTYRNAMLNINRYHLRASSCPDIYRNSMTTIAKEKSYWCQGFSEFKNLFLDILDLSYFGDIRFLLFAISNFLLYAWYDVPYVYLTDYAIEIGIEDTDASILIGIIGIVNMFGEIILGWFGDRKGVSPSIVYAGCMACCGAVIGLVPLYSSYTWLCTISGLFGLFIAANYALTSIILVELITIEKFTNAYGLLLLVQGIANLIGPPLAGLFYDLSGSYNLSFYVAGFFIVLSGLLLLIVPGLGKLKKYRALKLQNKSKLEKNINDNNCNSGNKNLKHFFENGFINKKDTPSDSV